MRLSAGGQSNVKTRASISEQLKELGGSSSSSISISLSDALLAGCLFDLVGVST